MNIGDRQREILRVFAGNRELVLTKKKIIELGGIGYYCNTDKHTGETLSRMVKSGLLIRVKKGSYKLGTGNKKQVEIENQIKLLI